MNGSTCSLCNEQGHNHMRCPDLTAPLRPGFHSGGDGGGGHGGDDDEHYMLPRSERLIGFATTVLFFDTSSPKVRSENSSTDVIHEVLTTMVFRFVV